MKKLLLGVLGVFMFSAAVQAQEFKPFKVGLGVGYAMPAGEGSGGGVLLYLEPMYRLSDEFAVGLRMESALVAKASFDPNTGEMGDMKISGLGSYTLSGQYYFSNGGFRPFVGAGTGLYRIASVTVTDGGSNPDGALAVSNKLGFYPRFGFDAGHFNMQLEYNLIGTTSAGTYNGEEVKIKNSYLGIKTGFSISGGRR
jgi:hypothetical protein